MSTVDAIYEHGMFRPLSQVDLMENQLVRLHFEPSVGENWRQWLEQTRDLQERLAEARGLFDSTAEIADDRRR